MQGIPDDDDENMSLIEPQSERSVLLTSLIESEGVRYGREGSFKMSHARLLTQRFLHCPNFFRFARA